MISSRFVSISMENKNQQITKKKRSYKLRSTQLVPGMSCFRISRIKISQSFRLYATQRRILAKMSRDIIKFQHVCVCLLSTIHFISPCQGVQNQTKTIRYQCGSKMFIFSAHGEMKAAARFWKVFFSFRLAGWLADYGIKP